MLLTPESSATLPGPEWLRARRATAAANLPQASFPTTQQELWKYSRVEDVDLSKFAPADSAPDDPGLPAVIEQMDRCALVVTVDGQVVEPAVPDASAKGLRVTTDWDGAGFGQAGPAADIFGHLNEAFTLSPLLIDIPAGLVLEKPIVVVHQMSGKSIASFPHLTIRVGANSQAKVVEIHMMADGQTADGEHSLVAPIVEHIVEQSARLTYVNVQRLASNVHHIGYNASRVQQQASFESTTIALGGDYARTRTDSHLDGPGAMSTLRALYFGTGNQMHDFRTLQAHHAPKTQSDLFFKGALGDKGRGVYSGLIRVDKGAGGTNAFQTNRNLILSDGAHAESVPNLEIEENDVKCSHASAIGPINEEQRYYLESRGVPTEVAARLIALGFLREILDNIGAGPLRAEIDVEVAAKLDAVGIEKLVTQ